MRFEFRFIEAFIERRLPLPDPLVQVVMNYYLALYNRLERVFGRLSSFIPPETEEIAARSAELMETHYNMPLQMFTNFLGSSMKYSMGLWEKGANDLDSAQEAMMADLCEKAGLRDGDRVLDIGCGFGSFANHVLRRYPNAKVYGLTLSRTQADYLREMQAEPGHPLNSDRFYLIQDDFNNVSFDQPFDRVISIGVFEHISNLNKALEKVRTFITDEGRCLLHYIVYRPPEGQSEAPRQDPFMDRYIFPGGRVWSDTELAKHQEHFKLEGHWFLRGTNYRRTLEAWLANYLRNYHKIQQESGLDDRKMRLWEFYLRACISTFRVRGGNFYGNGQYLLRPV